MERKEVEEVENKIVCEGIGRESEKLLVLFLFFDFFCEIGLFLVFLLVYNKVVNLFYN